MNLEQETENQKVMLPDDYATLNTLTEKYADSLKEALITANTLHFLNSTLTHQAVGDLDKFMKYDEAAKKIELMLSELQTRIAKLNGVLQ